MFSCPLRDLKDVWVRTLIEASKARGSQPLVVGGQSASEPIKALGETFCPALQLRMLLVHSPLLWSIANIKFARTEPAVPLRPREALALATYSTAAAAAAVWASRPVAPVSHAATPRESKVSGARGTRGDSQGQR